jgi:hypothetical protein
MDPHYPCFILGEFIPPDAFTGRNCGKPLKVGLKLNSFRITRYAGGMLDLRVDRQERFGPIELVIEQVEAYRRSLGELGEGMTGLIRVAGPDIGHVAERLRSLEQREQLSVEAFPGDPEKEL